MNSIVAETCLTFSAARLWDGLRPRVDCHIHTNWTDGVNTISECHEKAVRIGLTAVLFSEHTRLTSDSWFGEFAGVVRGLDASLCRAFVGTEVKVKNYEGEIDAHPAVLRNCDLVMVSVHRFLDSRGTPVEFKDVAPESALANEKRLAIAAIGNPHTKIIGHLFGMSITKYGQSPTDDDWREVVSEAARHDVAVEINSHYHPNPLGLLAICRDEGARVSLGSNSHELATIGESVLFLGG